MSEEKFDLIFKGELAKGVELAIAKKNIAQLFKINAEKVDALFSGKAVVLKRGLNADAANKYRVAIKKAGALVDLAINQPVQTRGKASFGEAPSASSQVTAPGAIPGTIPGTQSSVPTTAAAQKEASVAEQSSSGLTIAPAGSDLLQPSERAALPEVEVNTSAISLRENDGNLLDDSEYTQQPEVDFSFDEYDLAEPGADVLKPEERKKVTAVAVDTSGLEMGNLGENLAPPKKPAPAPPDTSGISLE
ncbi:hypothetical protein P886_2137 [Alteromonadaceae bacterium 2753L.S.0a.02]|nr:hypothetical protein P886_2137 [Alteromonadaceae bacterium 2753L.S.0a.02]